LLLDLLFAVKMAIDLRMQDFAWFFFWKIFLGGTGYWWNPRAHPTELLSRSENGRWRIPSRWVLYMERVHVKDHVCRFFWSVFYVYRQPRKRYILYVIFLV